MLKGTTFVLGSHLKDEGVIRKALEAKHYVIVAAKWEVSGTNSMAELDACPMHQRGTCTSVPVIYKALPHMHSTTCTTLVQHQHSNKRLTITPSYNKIALHLFVYETWWQRWTCSSRGNRRLRPVREKEKRKAIFQCSQLHQCPGG